MRSYKYFKKPKSGDCYVNTLLALLVIIFWIVITNACQHKDTSWEILRSKKSGSVLLAYVGSTESIYKDEHGDLHGRGVEILNDFISHTQTKYHVNISSEIQKFNNTEEVLQRVRTSNGGVFGWNIDPVDMQGLKTVDLVIDSTNKHSSKILLKASSDWIPLLASFLADKRTILYPDRALLNLDIESVQREKSF